MKDFFKSFFIRVIAVIVLVLIGMMIYSATTGGFATIPETVVGTVVTPLQSLVTGISNGVSGFFDRLTGSADTSAELQALREENTSLRNKMVDYDELKQQNDWYTEILGLHEIHSDYTFASGRVIGRDPSDVYGNFTMSGGKNADICANDPVITTDGYLIGVVDEVGLTYAKVKTVLDPSIKVSVQISRTGDTGYTSGSTVENVRQSLISLKTLERSSGAAIGDYVITSGIGGIYPEGLLIGSIRTVNSSSDGLTLNADVQMFADVLNTKRVMVITSFDGQQTEMEK